MNDELPPSINAAAGTGASASEALGDGIEVALEDDSLPTPIAPPVRASSTGRAKLRDMDEEAPTSRRVRPRMTLRIPDDEVARPLSAPPPEPSPPSKPEIAPPRLEPPPPPPRRLSDADSVRPPPPLAGTVPQARPGAAAASQAPPGVVVPRRSEIPPRGPESVVPRVEIAPQRIITINAPSRPEMLAGVIPTPPPPAPPKVPPSSPPDTEPLPSTELAANELTLDDEVEPITEDLAPTPRDAGPAPVILASPPSSQEGARLAPPPAPAPPLPVIMMDDEPARARANMVTIPDSDGGVDIPVVEDEEFARPSAPELMPDDLVSIESEPTMEQARPRMPPPAPPLPPGSNPSPIVSLEATGPSSQDAGRPQPIASPPPPPPVKPSHPPPSSGNSPPPVPVIPNRGMSSTPDISPDERSIASVPFVIGPAQSELAPPPLNDSVLQRKRARPWWEELFNDDFIRTMAKLTDAQIAAEADFIEDSLAVAKGAMVLDLACGTGRHAIELTRRGYQVVGYDLSLSMLARAADEAQDRNQKLNFVQGDMREMTFEETFDGIYSWNTSFGYFDEDRNGQVIARVHRALRKGGQFLLDVVNRDFIGRQAPSLAWFEGEGCVCMDEMTIDWITSRMRIKRTMMMDDGRSKEIEYSIRVYSLHELGKMLHDHGFRVAEVSGRIATPGVFFGTDSPRTLILAEKRG